MCDDCQLETAYEADRRYATAGKFNRETDPVTAPHAHLSQLDRYKAEMKAGIYHTAGYSPEQIAALQQLIATGKQYETQGSFDIVVADDFAEANEAEAQSYKDAGKLTHGPRTASNQLVTRLEFWSVFTRVKFGFTVKSDAQYALDVATREGEERAAAARGRVIRDLAEITVTPSPRHRLLHDDSTIGGHTAAEIVTEPA